MEDKKSWVRIAYIMGIIIFFVGTIDPMEGSVFISIGSGLLALSTYYLKDKHRKLFLATAILITVGVFFLFYLSSLGGFGGESERSYWWGLLIVPYPTGWLINIVLFVVRAIQHRKVKFAGKHE
jgi:hypothetical protein